MNRSILIVICDFLVLCALSISSGFHEQSAQVSQPLPGFQYTAVTNDVHSAVDLEDYQKLQQETDNLKQHLSQLREESKKMNEKLAAAAAALEKEQKDAAEKDSDLKRTRLNLQEIKTLLAETKNLAAERSRDMARQRKELALVNADLRERNSELNRTRLAANQKDRDLALANQQILFMKRSADAVSLDLKELRKKYDRERLLNRQAAVDLAKLQVNLTGMTEKAKKLQKNLERTQKQLADAEEKLRSRSIEKYLSSVVRLDSHIANIRPLLGKHVTDSTQYLPEIRLGKHVYLPGALLPVLGLDQDFPVHTRVSELSYTVSKVKGEPEKYTLSAPFIIPDDAPQICLIPVKQSSQEPLKVIRYSQLKKRGLRDLTLFKKNSLGTETAELAERCSFDNARGSGYLLVRNSLRNSTQLPAEPGDVIITKEGFLAAIVIGLSREKTGYRYAFCMVFPDQKFEKGKNLPIVKQKSEKDFTSFTRLSEIYRLIADTNLSKKSKGIVK